MKQKYQYFISVILFILAFWGVTYTSDWGSYEHAFDHDLTMKSDIATFYLFNFLKEHGFNNYQAAYRLHVLIMALLFPALYSRFNVSPISYTLILIIFSYVAVANQVRYFVAFPISLLGILYLYKRKYLPFLFLSIIAMLFHATTIVLIILNLCFFIASKSITLNNSKIVLYICFGVVIAIFSRNIIYLLPSSFTDDYMAYYESGWTSSLLGGIYNSIPGIFAIIAILHIRSKVPYGLATEREKLELIILDRISISTSVLIPISFTMQIFYHRMIITLLPIWIIYLFKIDKLFRKQGSKTNVRMFSWGILLIVLLWQTIVPYILNIRPTILDQELVKIISSYTL